MNISITAEDFESVALPHLNDLYRAARRIIGNPTEAEDAVQETYHQAWKSFHRFEAGTNCRAWLFKILFHVIHHQRRKLWKWASFASLDEAPEKIPIYEPPAPQDLTDEEVLQAFEKLPPHYREVVMLADVQEFSYKEIADTLSIPIGTVMSRLNRGRKLLRADLAGVAESYGIRIDEEAARAFSTA
jgi:RNA polymerase sigma-70 factor (ECF subfamily)